VQNCTQKLHLVLALFYDFYRTKPYRMKQKSYHTSIKTCYALGLEEVLPESLREHIPRSTSHYWKSEQETKYVGHEFAARVSKNLDQASILLNDRVKHERALFVAFCRIKLTIINFIGRRSFTKLLQSNKPQVVSMVEKVKPLFGTNTICKFLNIEPKTYSAISNQTQ